MANSRFPYVVKKIDRAEKLLAEATELAAEFIDSDDFESLIGCQETMNRQLRRMQEIEREVLDWHPNMPPDAKFPTATPSIEAMLVLTQIDDHLDDFEQDLQAIATKPMVHELARLRTSLRRLYGLLSAQAETIDPKCRICTTPLRYGLIEALRTALRRYGFLPAAKTSDKTPAKTGDKKNATAESPAA